ncbi:MAG: hypothetical protein AAB800_00535 [Patescibacteria group bacterium]
MRERERERETVTSSPSFPRRHKILFGFIATIGVLIYAAFNLWFYRYSTSGKAPSPKAVWQALKDDTPPRRGVIFTETVTPASTPTPRPTGPGQYACSQEGVCNVYSDAARTQYCTVTFADSRCLDQCGTKENQCKK